MEEEKQIEEEEVTEEKKKKEKKERICVLNIYTTFNNTLINLTDLSGRTITKFTGGQMTKQDRLKANPTVAMFIAQKIGLAFNLSCFVI
jgi:ribosomal protein S11